MHLPWKKSKSKSKTGRISRLVSDLQQSPKRGGSLVVETGFPTSLIDLFVKNRNRLKKPPSSKKRSKDNDDKSQARLTAAPDNSHPPLQRLVSSPSPPSKPLRRGKSLPQKLDLASVTEKLTASKSEVSFSNRGGLTSEVRNDGEEKDGEIGGRCGGGGGGGGCFFMVVAIKVFAVAVLALSTKKLAVGITLSAFALLFLELAVARVFTLLNLCPNAAQIRLNYLIVKLIGKKQREKIEESTTQERGNTVSFEIIEESMEETQAEEKISNFEDTSKLVKAKPLEEETVRDVVSTKEKSKSSKLKSKIVKKIVPKKLRSYKKKKKMTKIKTEEEYVVEEEEGHVTEVASLFSESEISEISSNPPLLESCCEEIQEEEEEEEDYDGSKGDITKVIVLIVIVLAGLLSGKVLAFVLTFSSCLILKVVCNKSQTSL
ncbi:unnamed protein product [Cochlearia groenlandica]